MTDSPNSLSTALWLPLSRTLQYPGRGCVLHSLSLERLLEFGYVLRVLTLVQGKEDTPLRHDQRGKETFQETSW